MNLQGKNIVVYDCEIVNDVDGTKVGWNDHDKMGLSVACLYDYATDDFSVYFQEDIQALCARLNCANLVVGFNTTGFDNKLLRASGGDLKPDGELRNYDILFHSRQSTGWNQSMRFPSGMKLDDHLSSMFGESFKKTEDGAVAPRMWRDGQKGRVVSYCLADVKRERMVFEHIAHKGWASTAAHGPHFFDLKPIQEACR